MKILQFFINPVKILITGLILVLFGCGNQNVTSLEIANMKGNVQKIKLNKYYIKEKFGKIEPDKLKESGDIFYNNDGFTTEVHKYRIENNERYSKISITKYHYDEEHRELKIEEFTKDKLDYMTKLSHTEDTSKITKYNEHGNVRDERTGTRFNNILFSKINYISDNAYQTFEFNNANLATKTSYYSDDYKSERYISYDKNMNHKEEKVYSTFSDNSPDTTIFTFEYPELDKNNNWTKIIISKDGTPDEIHIREITYYGDSETKKSNTSPAELNTFISRWYIKNTNGTLVNIDGWFVFQEDMTFQSGKGASITTKGKFSLDNEAETITLFVDEGRSYTFKYAYGNGYQLLLKSLDDSEFITLHKRD